MSSKRLSLSLFILQLCMMLLELELNMHSIVLPDMLDFCFFLDMLAICLKLDSLEIKGQIIKLGIIGLTNLCLVRVSQSEPEIMSASGARPGCWLRDNQLMVSLSR